MLLLYYYLDNGSNTCGIDFHFKNDQKEVDVEVNENEESIPLNPRSSIITDEEPRGDKYFEFRVLEKLFISEFNVVSEEGR